MPTQQIPSERSAIIRKIRRSFFAHRRDYPDQLYIKSEKLRQLVRVALSDGHKVSTVAHAAGLNRQTILYWNQRAIESHSRRPQDSIADETPIALPVELTVVKNRSNTPSQSEMSQPRVRVYFRSGAIMECSASAMTADLVVALNGGVP